MSTIIVYTSMTGNTELMAHAIADELRQKGEHVEVKDAIDTFANELHSHKKILIGSYTWGNGDLPDEIFDFYEELKEIDLSTKIGAVFGPGDSSYHSFAGAVDILEQTLKRQGCELVTEGLKVDRVSEGEILTSCKNFATAFLKGLVSIDAQKTKSTLRFGLAY